MTPHRPLPKDVSFPALEEQILERWRERDVYRESLRRREGGTPYVFYEGPPTANGRPGSHHVLARVFKDVFPRYKTMQGFYSYRKGGWDCHGLPVEIAVQNQLGIENKQQIEEYGIAEFNQKCRESVFEFLEDWTRLTERIGYWVDLDEPYRTLDTKYIESVWWALKQLWDKDLLYEGFKVVPYCPRDGTSLSSHEVSRGLQGRRGPERLRPLPDHEGRRRAARGRQPARLDHDAVDARLQRRGRRRSRARPTCAPPTGEVLAEALVTRVLGEDAQVADRFTGAEMVGAAYEPPFPFISAEAYGAKGHTVLPADFVSAEDGTGIVHTAIAFGEDDFRLGAEQGLNVINPVRPDGTYDERIGPYEGRFVKDADDDLIEDLRSRGRLHRAERLLHSYPHCWRCGTPLLYYAKRTWFIRTSQVKDRLLAANESVDWHPEHIKHGRFGRWLENNVDWALGRERYWGTPLPIWRNAAGETVAVGSFEELREHSGVLIDDPHRPFVDDVEIPSPTGGEPLRRVPEVIDVWFDSGSMPFAQWHAPFENQDLFEQQFPADYICEGIDQTRGWFYSLIAISTLLFDQSSFKTCLCLGHLADPDGKKMSKSLGNIVVPWDVIDRHGADAFRWYFLSQQAALGRLPVRHRHRRRVAAPVPAAALEHVRLLRALRERQRRRAGGRRAGERSGPLGAVAARGDGGDGHRAPGRLRRHPRRPGDRGVRRRPLELVRPPLAPALLGRRPGRVRDAAHVPGDGHAAARAVHAVHRRRDLRQPRRVGAQRPPHGLAEGRRARRGPGVRDGDRARDRPARPGRARAGEAQGAPAAARRRGRRRGRRARGDRAARVGRARGAQRQGRCATSRRPTSSAPTRSSPTTARSARASASRCRRWPRPSPRSIPRTSASALRDGGRVGISIDGHDHELDTDDLMLAMKPLDGYQLEREGSHAVALELELDDELRREGLAREIVHAVQNARKAAGLQVEDRIELLLGGEAELLEAARAHEPYVARETLAISVAYDGAAGVEPVTIEGRPLHIAVTRA